MVNMNEDFGAYKDSIWKGLTARELYKNSELFSHHTFQNNQKNAESLFCVS